MAQTMLPASKSNGVHCLFEIEGSAADISNGPYRAVRLFLFECGRAVRLFLFECGTKTINTGVAVHAEGAGAVGYGVPVREDHNWWGGELGEDLANDNFQSRRKIVLRALPEKGVERTYPLGQVG